MANARKGEMMPLKPKSPLGKGTIPTGPIVNRRPPAGASPGYPGWLCKNQCGFQLKEGAKANHFPEDYKKDRCPNCRSPLVRWIKYEEKGR